MSEETQNTQPDEVRASATKSDKKTTKQTEKEDMVEVSRSDLNRVLENMEAVQKDNAELREKISIVENTVSKQRLSESKEDLGIGEDKRLRFYLKRRQGKVIHSWKGKNESAALQNNSVVYNGNTPVAEVVKAHLVYLDKDENKEPIEEVVDLKEFSQNTDLVYFRLVDQAVEKDATGKDALMITGEFEDASLQEKYGTFKINQNFVNP